MGFEHVVSKIENENRKKLIKLLSMLYGIHLTTK